MTIVVQLADIKENVSRDWAIFLIFTCSNDLITQKDISPVNASLRCLNNVSGVYLSRFPCLFLQVSDLASH